MEERRVAVLGSTGSVGKQALEVIDSVPELTVCALSAGQNNELLAEQIEQYKPEAVAMAEGQAAEQLKDSVSGGARILNGPDAATELIYETHPDAVLVGVSGTAGVRPTLAGIECGSIIAIANKETLVMAGHIVNSAAKKSSARIIPVDSEHAAIFQCLYSGSHDEIHKVIITASGGALRDWADEDTKGASVEDVLNHPTWQMGRKITIDSATMLNKALEMIEAHWLFDLSDEQIDVVVHPEAIVHSFVEYCDGSIMAQLARPEMTLPISMALCYPKRASRRYERLDLAELGKLNFLPLTERFKRSIDIGYETIRKGDLAGAAFLGADEAAVKAFLAGKITFDRIVPLVEEAVAGAETSDSASLEDLFAAEEETCSRVESSIKN